MTTNTSLPGCSTLTFRMLDRATALDWIAAEGFKTIDLGVIAKFCPHVDALAATADDHKRIADEIASRGAAPRRRARLLRALDAARTQSRSRRVARTGAIRREHC